MTFESHKVVKDYLTELNKIIALRADTRSRLIDALEVLAETRTDCGTSEEYQRANQRVKELELQVSTLTSKGERYIYKIDQLNGVRQ